MTRCKVLDAVQGVANILRNTKTLNMATTPKLTRHIVVFCTLEPMMQENTVLLILQVETQNFAQSNKERTSWIGITK